MRPYLLALSLFTAVSSALAQAPVAEVTGMLEYISPSAIVVRAQDNREFQVRIAQVSPGLANDRQIGDWVYLKFQKTTPTLDNSLNVMLYVELTDFLPLHKPFQSELEAAFASPSHKFPGNLLRAPPSQPAEELPALPPLLEKANAHLPELSNFIADESTTRFNGSADFAESRPFDHIQSEVRVSGCREIRTNILRNNRPWNSPYGALPGMKWQTAYSGHLGSLFANRRKVTFSEEGSSVLNGRAVTVFAFRTPADSLSHWYLNEQSFWPASQGKVWIANEDGRVLQIEQSSTEFPPDFPLASATQHVAFDYVQVGPSREALPVASDILWTYHDSDRKALNKNVYTNHRRLQADPPITP